MIKDVFPPLGYKLRNEFVINTCFLARIIIGHVALLVYMFILIFR